MYAIVQRHTNESTGTYEWFFPDQDGIIWDTLKQAQHDLTNNSNYNWDEFNEYHIVRLDFGWK